MRQSNTDFAGFFLDPVVPSHLKGRAQLQLFPPTIDVPDSSGTRLTITIPMMSRYFPDPQTSALAPFIRGEIHITASLSQVISQVGRVVELDLKSATVVVNFVPTFSSRPLPAEDLAAINLLLRNALKNSFLPSNANLPSKIAHVGFTTLRGTQNALAVLLNLSSGGTGNPATVSNVFLHSADHFGFAAGVDFVKASFQPTLDNILNQGIDPVHFNISTLLHTFHITYTITLRSATIGLEPGKDVQVLPMGGSGAGRLAVLEQGVVDAALLSVPENVLALHKGYNELIFLGDVLSFPQNGFGTSTSRIQQQPEEVYRMVRAALRGLLFVTDDGNRDAARDIMMKQWRISDGKLAGEMLGYLKRGLAKDALVSQEAVQYFVDLTRESSNVTQPISAGQVVDFTFLDRARKELRGGK